MGKISSPSDYTNIDVTDYTDGKGYYTTERDVSHLLQIADFGDSTTPTKSEVGKIIKRVEERIDSAIKMSYRPLIYQNEIHHFDAGRHRTYPVSEWKEYAGFVKLNHRSIQKIIRLEVWQGSQYTDIAGASAKLKIPDGATTSNWTITLTVGSPTTYTFQIRNLADNSVRDFYDNFGKKTTASQIVDAINEVFPHKTAKFTGETAAKSIKDTSNAVNISDFFVATIDSESSDTVVISSLLPGDDGQNCGITSTYGTVTNFSDNENKGRTDDWWFLSSDGMIFFRANYPYSRHNSVRVSYVSGSSRVPASIHDAATKLVAAEVIRHDDNSIMVAETGSNIDLKTKHDILIEEANKIIDGKKETIVFIS